MKCFLSILFSLSLAIPAAAQALKVETQFSLLSSYQTQHGMLLYNRPSAQFSVTVKKNGFGFEAWADQSLDGADREIDLTGSKNWKYGGASFAYFDIRPVFQPDDNLMASAWLGVPWKAGNHSFRAYVRGNRLMPLKDGADPSNWLRIGLAHELKTRRGTLASEGWAMRDYGAKGGPGEIIRLQSGFAFDRGTYILQPLAQLSLPFGNARMSAPTLGAPSRERHVVVGVKIANKPTK